MGNIIGGIDMWADKQKISELEFDNQALKKQVNSLKEIIQKEGKIIAQMERENRELKCKNEKDCIVCHFLNN